MNMAIVSPDFTWPALMLVQFSVPWLWRLLVSVHSVYPHSTYPHFWTWLEEGIKPVIYKARDYNYNNHLFVSIHLDIIEGFDN